MKKVKIYLLFTILVSVLLSCDSEKEKVLPAYTGASGELMFICDDATWNSIKDSVEVWFQNNYPSIPQPEAMFRVSQFNAGEVNTLLERHRNTIAINFDQKAQPSLKLYKNYKSKGQVYFNVVAGNNEEVLNLLAAKQKQINKTLKTEERKRYAQKLKAFPNRDAQIWLKKNLGLNVNIPKGFEFVDQDSTFAWFKRERMKNLGGTKHYIEENLVIYMDSYRNEDQFKDSALVEMRDRVLGKRIPGPKPKSKMTTQDTPFVQQTFESVMLHNRYSVEWRALWRASDSFIGGPFVALTTLNPNQDKVVTVEGFINAPKFNKREYIKQMEALIYTLQFEK